MTQSEFSTRLAARTVKNALGTAKFSPDRVHRYSLSRFWLDYEASCQRTVLFIGLNPSRADESNNDATIRRCIDYTIRWGYDQLVFSNLYSIRTPKVKGPMTAVEIAEGFSPLVDHLGRATTEFTDLDLRVAATISNRIVCAWGSWPFCWDRACKVMQIIKEHHSGSPQCLGVNKDGSPVHPLYQPRDAQLKNYILPSA